MRRALHSADNPQLFDTHVLCVGRGAGWRGRGAAVEKGGFRLAESCAVASGGSEIGFGLLPPARNFRRGERRGKFSPGNAAGGLGAERFPKAAPLDVIASWGKVAWPWLVAAQTPAAGAVRCGAARCGCSQHPAAWPAPAASRRGVLDITVLRRRAVQPWMEGRIGDTDPRAWSPNLGQSETEERG